MVKYHTLAAKFQSPIAVTPIIIESNNSTNNIYFTYFNLLTQAFNVSYDRFFNECLKTTKQMFDYPSDCTR